MLKISRSPLFEKLIDENPQESFEETPQNLQSLEELQESIKEDLSRLLNTRLPFFWRDLENQKNSPIPFMYGVNLTSAIFTEDTVEIREVEARIERALRAFESRLIDPRVKLQKLDNAPESLFAHIDAVVEIADRRIPMSFPITINNLQ